MVVACFGMNDGNYHPFDEDRFARFQAGVRRLIARTRDEAHARLVILTPPPFDPYQRKVGDPKAKEFGYKYPAINYDDTLDRYSRWLLTLRDEGIPVVDLHAALNEHLRKRREGEVSFFLAGDAVHPNATGHWLMAQTLLRRWNAPGLVAEARVDAGTGRAEPEEVHEIDHVGDVLRFTWRSPLPAPLPPEADARSIELEQVGERLNRYRLTVTGLPAGRYRLMATRDGEKIETAVAEVDAADLAKGLDLTAFPRFPTVRTSQFVRERLQVRNQARYNRWRAAIARSEPTTTEVPEDDAESIEIRRLCQPTDVTVRLIPIHP